LRRNPAFPEDHSVSAAPVIGEAGWPEFDDEATSGETEETQ
jgi:hypothetical protein